MLLHQAAAGLTPVVVVADQGGSSRGGLHLQGPALGLHKQHGCGVGLCDHGRAVALAGHAQLRVPFLTLMPAVVSPTGPGWAQSPARAGAYCVHDRSKLVQRLLWLCTVVSSWQKPHLLPAG